MGKFFALLIIVCGSAATLWLATPLGVVIFPDSAQYLVAAQAWADHGTLEVFAPNGEAFPLTRFAPLYPLLLGTIMLTGVTALVAAHIAAALVYGINIALTYLVTTRYSNRPLVGASLTALLATNATIVDLHTAALSEPLFMTGVLLFFLGIADADGKGFLASVGIMISALTRYVGLCMIPFIWTIRRAILQSAVRVIAYQILTIGLPLFWFATRPTLVRELQIRPFDISELWRGATALGTLFAPALPREYAMWFAIFIIVFGAGFAALRSGRIVLTALSFIVLYCASVVASRYFLDAAVPFNTRMLSPLLIPAVVMLALSFRRDRLDWHESMVRSVLAVATEPVPKPMSVPMFASIAISMAVVMYVQVIGNADALIRLNEGKFFLYSTEGLASPIIKTISRSSPDDVYLSNVPELVWLFSSAHGVQLPAITDTDTGLKNENVAQEIQAQRALVTSPHVLRVFINREIHFRSYLPDEEQLRSLLPLELEAQDDRYALYRVINPPTNPAPPRTPINPIRRP